MLKFFLCSLVLALAAGAVRAEFKPINLPSERLPIQVRPLEYKLDLDLSEAPDESYWGQVNITVEFMGPDNSKIKRCLNKLTAHLFSAKPQCEREAKKNQIIMHADESLYLSSVKIFKLKTSKEGQEKLEPLRISRMSRDAAKQLIVFDMFSELPLAGRKGLISIKFKGEVRDDLFGIYKSRYDHQGKIYYQIAAKFQPTFARLALPCFDEPGFKAQFSLSIIHPNGVHAYATTELLEEEQWGYHRRSTFARTPPMSIHMFAFTLGRYDEPLEVQMRPDLRLRAITPPGKREAGAYALEVAQYAIEWFERYIDFRFPLEKLDLVAIPDTDTDNTETWGLVFVRDILALIDDETKPDTRITTAVNVAHIMVHQWFANLITADWWDDLWITESVAAQMAFEIVADMFPEQSNYLVRIATLSGILTSDSSGRNHSLSPHPSELRTSSQVYQIFDNIEFMKSGALARLLQNTLGYEEFRKVLQKLIRDNAYGNVDMADLMDAIESSSESSKWPMGEILLTWSKLRSYPVINVALSESTNSIELYQEPRPTAKELVRTPTSFIPLPNRPDAWTLPLKVLLSNVTGERQLVKEANLGFGTKGTVKLPSWFEPGRDWIKVSPNPDLSTYYRVRYSKELIQKFKTPVEEKQLPDMDRVHLLDDTRALAASGLVRTPILKELLEWHGQETSSGVIIEMLLTSQTLRSLNVTSVPQASQVYMEVFRRSGFKVTGEETLLDQRARMVVLRALVTQGVQEVVEAALEAYAESEGNVALFLREPVYAAVVAAGTPEQVGQLQARLTRSESHEELVRLASALALSRDPTVLDSLSSWLDEKSGFKEASKAPIRASIAQTRSALASAS